MVETYARYDFIAERAEGMYLYDEKGVAYLDFYGGVAVNTPGNRNPKVVAAVKDQLDDHHAYIQLPIHNSTGTSRKEDL